MVVSVWLGQKMAYEKRWAAVPPQNFIANGTNVGKITVIDASLFKVKQQVVIVSNTQTNLNLQVQRIDTATELYVGPSGSQINARTDVSAYTVADSANIYAIEQPRSSVPEEQVERLTYEEEPTVARRAVLVDKLGNKIDNVVDNNGINRLAVDGQFHAEVDVEVDVDINGVYDPSTNPDPDNIGLISHTRSNPTDETKQVERITAKRGTVDTDTVSQDVSIHDHQGNEYTVANPLPVIGGFERFLELISASKWMELGNYDEVIPTYAGLDLILAYKEDGALLGEAVISNYASLTGWSIKLNRYIDDDDGSQLLDDDDEPLNLD